MAPANCLCHAVTLHHTVMWEESHPLVTCASVLSLPDIITSSQTEIGAGTTSQYPEPGPDIRATDCLTN